MLATLPHSSHSLPTHPTRPSEQASADARLGLSPTRPFAQAITPHLPRLVRAAREILGSEDLAWDAVQETLLRLWLRGWLPENPEGALVHLVVKSSLHQLRCQRRRHFHESQEPEDHGPCCEEDPLALLEGAERAAIVREAIEDMADEYRAVLELFEFHGESYEAIAEQLEVPIGTVRSRLSRGRDLLRQRLLSRIPA